MAQRSSLVQITHSLHSARMATYLAASQNDPARALRLYRWNLRLAGAFQEVLSVTEIVLRNAIDESLRHWNTDQMRADESGQHTADWLEDPARPLSSLTRSARETARRHADVARTSRPPSHPRKNAPISHDDLLAQLTFGVFVKLRPSSNEQEGSYRARQILWDEAIHDAFPHRGSTDPEGLILADRVRRLHALRNRVSHMEPLLAVNAPARHTDALQVIAAVNPAARDWCAGVSRVREVAQGRPR